MLEARVGIGVRDGVDSKEVIDSSIRSMTMIRSTDGFQVQKRVQGRSGKQRFEEALLPFLLRLLRCGYSRIPFRATTPAWGQFVSLRNGFVLPAVSTLVHTRRSRFFPCARHCRS